MSQPNRRLPGSTYGVAVRCSERRFFLAPSRFTTLLLGFLLAFQLRRHGLLLHGVAVLSNHYHLVLTDPHGNLGAFLRDLNGYVARALNARFDRREALFSTRGPAAWELDGPDDVLAHLAYLATNPVAAGLTPEPAAWPGLLTLPHHFLRRARRFYQPARGFFGVGQSQILPAFVDLELTLPPGWTDRQAFVQAFERTLAQHLAGLRPRPGHVYPTAQALRRQPVHEAPTTPLEPFGGRVPHLSNATKERKQELQAFRGAYAHALYAYRHGCRDVEFPPGTDLLRRVHKVRVAARE